MQDEGKFLTPNALSLLNEKIANVKQATGYTIDVYTADGLGGASPQELAERVFAEHQIRGVLLLAVRNPKVLGVVPDRSLRTIFSHDATEKVRNAIKTRFNAGDFDGGIINAVQLTSEYLPH